jgi:hypothetical protein
MIITNAGKMLINDGREKKYFLTCKPRKWLNMNNPRFYRGLISSSQVKSPGGA